MDEVTVINELQKRVEELEKQNAELVYQNQLYRAELNTVDVKVREMLDVLKVY